MRSLVLIVTIFGPPILIRWVFSEVGLVYSGVMAILAVLFFHAILFRPEDFKTWTVDGHLDEGCLCGKCLENPGTHADPSGGPGPVCESCAK